MGKPKRLWCIKTKIACNQNIWVKADSASTDEAGSLFFFVRGDDLAKLALAREKWSAVIECDPITRKPLIDIEWCGHGMDKEPCRS
ncbi:hypothetical protein C9J01_10605 [Photobacterium rosenbergii]|uniref:Uncharacterized protein n=1 Tax=Photobacterium rosenbergii TaxID=294936 RepID=A0A2T3NFH4_9GAMM|nr:hypothetical protein C9J01_10605 [Photobacterium rosenbergii]